MLLFLVILAASVGWAQSHPSWWTYATPRATALVGIQWDSIRHSPAAPLVKERLAGLGLTELPCLEDAQQFLISAPELLAMVYEACAGPALEREASVKGWRQTSYKGAELWVAPGAGTLSVARVSEQLLMLGAVATLREGIDRMLDRERAYSKLLARAALYARQHLWVVASRLPDPLATPFLPIETRAFSFEGSVSFWEGMHLVATLEAPGGLAAESLAEALQASNEALQISTEGRTVFVNLDLMPEETAAVFPAPVAPVQAVAEAAPQPEPAKPPPAAEATKPAPAAPPAPKVVRILGLEGGTREIVIPLAPSSPTSTGSPRP
jgi:hypothetical protein